MDVEDIQILHRAKEWFKAQNIPRECPVSRCGAVDAWKPGKVTQLANPQLEGRPLRLPNIFTVQLVCGRCNSSYATYEEADGISTK